MGERPGREIDGLGVVERVRDVDDPARRRPGVLLKVDLARVCEKAARLVDRVVVGRGRWTAARTFSRPAPCCSAGAATSVAVLVRICLTSAGDGSAP